MIVNNKSMIFRFFLTLIIIAISQTGFLAQDKAEKITAATLNKEIRDFSAREIAYHFADIKTLNPPPDRVSGALTVGEFSWGSYARACGAG